MVAIAFFLAARWFPEGEILYFVSLCTSLSYPGETLGMKIALVSLRLFVQAKKKKCQRIIIATDNEGWYRAFTIHLLQRKILSTGHLL